MSEISLKDIFPLSDVSEDENSQSELDATKIEMDNSAQEDTVNLVESADEEINESRQTDSMLTAREELSYSLNSLDEQWWENLEFPSGSGGDTTYFTAQESIMSLLDVAAHEESNSLRLSNESWWDALSDPEENTANKNPANLIRRRRVVFILVVVLCIILLIVGLVLGGVLGHAICPFLH